MKKSTGKPIPFTNAELSAFCGQLALLLQSGISSLEGISVMLEDSTDKEEQQILTVILDELNRGGSLADALKAADVFPPYMLHMTQLGEETGTLDTVMDGLARQYDREDDIRRSIRSSVTYPLIMASMMIVVILILIIKVLPIFQQVFAQLGSEMTGFSRTLLQAGSILRTNALIFTIVIFLIAVLVFCGLRTDAGIRLMRNLGQKLPFTRSIYEKTAACRFADAMSLALSSGLHPERSMELMCELNEDPVFAEKLDTCRRLQEEGKELSDALHDAGIFTGTCARLITLGARTGRMEDVMAQIAALYQDEIDARLTHILSVLEPTLVIVLSLIVGVILFSVMLPLMGIMSGI